ncbi:LacI family DNA-binding transcriptional regulator [Ligilactobacillus agilis]|uniref:LacI family DNA-binding transcriptional regulator n=1 Tax=Ligilactobacillus agilis TaxID=1601 RepID=UPI00067F02E0|nr:LacI family DNA-binding transcriptional regulator [Ligilactobacillus agilis]
MTTMNDVARLAGVSRGTVSNYINGVKIKAESQKKVQAAIDELGYIPNLTARNLKKSRSDLVALILPTTQSPFFSELVFTLQQVLKKQNFKTILCNSNNDISEELEYLQMAKEQKVAGIITISYSELPVNLLQGVNIVSIEKKLSATIPCVSVENSVGGRMAAAELTKRGADKLLVISRKTDKTVFNYGQRVGGFTSYCEKEQVEYSVFNPELHDDRFYGELGEFLDNEFKNLGVNGIFAVSDQYADFVYRKLSANGYKIPEDVQIIGFDGSKMYPQQPALLSSIRQPVELIAEKCVWQLMAILRGDDIDKKQITFIPVTFIEGNTTKKTN